MLDPSSLAARPLHVDGVEFRVAPLGGFDIPDHLVVVKPPDAIDAYRRLLGRFDRPRMVELGIAYGGSIGLFALLARPDRFVGLELASDRVSLLDDLITDRGLQDAVHLHYGIDQSDRERLTQIIDAEFGGQALDLVIDDASHLYHETVASFEVLFPRLRPGGSFIIEDWSCDHGIHSLLAEALGDPTSPYHPWAEEVLAGTVESANSGQVAQTAVAAAAITGERSDQASTWPLSRLASQLALGPAEPDSGIASVSTNSFWIEVQRSDSPLPEPFTLATACPDRFSTLKP